MRGLAAGAVSIVIQILRLRVPMDERIGGCNGFHRDSNTALRRAPMDERIGSWSGFHRDSNTVCVKRLHVDERIGSWSGFHRDSNTALRKAQINERIGKLEQCTSWFKYCAQKGTS